MQGVFTAIVSEGAPPATLAMLRLSRFLAYADPAGHGPPPPAETLPVEPGDTFSVQPPAEQPAAALPSGEGAATEASSDAGPDDGARLSVDRQNRWSRSQASEPRNAASEENTSTAAHEAALPAGADSVAAGEDSDFGNSGGGSPAASDRMELQLPPMVRCTSPPPAGLRPPHAAGQRQHAFVAGPLGGPVALSDAVQMGSSCSAGAASHDSLSRAILPRRISQASLSPPSPRSLASVSPAEPADRLTDELSGALAGPCDAVCPDEAPTELLGSGTGGLDGGDPATAFDPALAHTDNAIRGPAEHRCISIVAETNTTTTFWPPSERAQDLTLADEDLLRDLRHSAARSHDGPDGGALPPGGSLQDVPEYRGLPKSGAGPRHVSDNTLCFPFKPPQDRSC